MKLILNFISSFSMMFATIYFWHKLLKIKINFKNPKIYVATLLLSIVSMLNYFFVNSFIRVSIITIVLMFFFRYLFKENLQKTILTPIYSQAILMIAECTYVLMITIVFNKNISFSLQTDFGIFIANMMITIMFLLLLKIKIFDTIYNKLLKFTSKIKSSQLILICLITILFLNFYIITAYYKIKFEYWIITNILLIVLCFFIVFYTFKTKNNYNIVNDKYSVAINSLKEYENMMTKYRISNHENKNLLLTVRAMILNKEKNILKYIDSIVKEKYEDDEKLLFKMNVIPSGGLRATIYSGILKIKENNIDHILDIDRKLSTVDLIELDENTIIDVCKILGVFIDNSIEEVEKLKEKNIEINLYIEKDNICIKVSNNYKGKIDVEKIYDSGYTTKGKNHGYGLSLVKDIVDKNNYLDTFVEIDKKVFSQILKLKYKKKKSHKK